MTEDLQEKTGAFAEPGFEVTYGDNQGELIESLEKLLHKLEDLEKQQAQDRKVIEQALDRVKALGQQHPAQTDFPALPDDFGEAIIRWLKTAKNLARMVDTLAGSLLTMTEATAAVNRRPAGDGSGSQLDLSGLLGLVADFVKDMNQQNQAERNGLTV